LSALFSEFLVSVDLSAFDGQHDASRKWFQVSGFRCQQDEVPWPETLLEATSKTNRRQVNFSGQRVAGGTSENLL